MGLYNRSLHDESSVKISKYNLIKKRGSTITTLKWHIDQHVHNQHHPSNFRIKNYIFINRQSISTSKTTKRQIIRESPNSILGGTILGQTKKISIRSKDQLIWRPIPPSSIWTNTHKLAPGGFGLETLRGAHSKVSSLPMKHGHGYRY
jgi:hypothetical protein